MAVVPLFPLSSEFRLSLFIFARESVLYTSLVFVYGLLVLDETEAGDNITIFFEFKAAYAVARLSSMLFWCFSSLALMIRLASIREFFVLPLSGGLLTSAGKTGP